MSKAAAQQRESRALTSFFGAEDIMVQQEGFQRNALLRNLLEHLADNHGLRNVDAYYNAVVRRENAMGTVLASGIAIPHARLEGLSQPYVAIATSEGGIAFEEGAPLTHLVFVVLIPRDQPGFYLQILRALSSIMRNKDAARTVSRLKTAGEVMRFFGRGDMVLPGYVCAADIMCDAPTVLRDSDSLKTAIDCFISKDLSEVPVVDGDGDMVGVVSARALMRVCLPEYLLWMDDLSAMVNFEPFAGVLRNEQNTWLSDILSGEYPAVQVGAPAISVAAELARRDASRCYVLNGGKLAGIIDLPVFLNKIFRE
ncbi:MAG: PTS sugar transporter subunit IIA [Kiritimatiellaeota bacterium]|nr:PTS sugar transporter subunit IIA [Kiritimatiellota bacterium]